MLTFSWLRQLPWVRVLLVALVLAATFVFPAAEQAVFRAFLGTFLVYALVLAVRRRALSGIAGLLALFADTVFFLAVAALGSEPLLWGAAVYFLYLLGEALAFYTSLELVVITGVSGVFCAVAPFPMARALEPTVVVAGLLACGSALSRQRQTKEVEALSQRVIAAEKDADKARDEERHRIAADFHDGPLQSFISVQMRLEILRKLMERNFEAGMADLTELQRVAQAQVRDLRTFLHSMRPVDVDGANFVATARRMAESFQKESGIPVTFSGANSSLGLPQDTTLEVLQMMRESLHNVQKHAGATRVAVSLEKSEKGLEISIDDNGHGFPFAGNYTLEELELLRLGPASLKRRARSLNAELMLESRPGRGAGLKFRIPL